MRARLGLAHCLWRLGEYDEAISHYREMLKLNPCDNQGIRYILATSLAELERYDELEKFLNSREYKNDGGTDWLWTKALLTFVRKGDSEEAVRQLKDALKENPYVPQYLTGKKKIPADLLDMITIGGEYEAVVYASVAIRAWQKVPGLIEWLKQQTGIKIYPKVGRNAPCPCGSGKNTKSVAGDKMKQVRPKRCTKIAINAITVR